LNKLLLTGCLVLCSLNCFSTCIAIYVAKNGRIYIAADSRRTFYFNTKYKSELICKIHHVGTNYFAVAGIDDSSLLNAANSALAQTSDVDSALQIFEKTMVARYTFLMTAARQYYPDKFKHFLQDGLASVSFFGYYKGDPYVTDVNFMVYCDDEQHINITYRTKPVSTITVIGISEDIAKLQPEDLPSAEMIQKSPELYVESLVKIEARKKPLAVSEPIDLLELGPDGPNWIRRNNTSDSY
jgi:hypothetical protein